jgi:hypothetical protein
MSKDHSDDQDITHIKGRDDIIGAVKAHPKTPGSTITFGFDGVAQEGGRAAVNSLWEAIKAEAGTAKMNMCFFTGWVRF